MAKWKTRRTQNPLGESPWGFESPSRYQRVARGDTSQFVTAELQTYQQHHRSDPLGSDVLLPSRTIPHLRARPHQPERHSAPPNRPRRRFECVAGRHVRVGLCQTRIRKADQLPAGLPPLCSAAAISLAHASMSSQSRKSPSSARTARMIALSAKLNLSRSSAPAKTR